jgi:tetratricopeptide (TPR) repeat protein
MRKPSPKPSPLQPATALIVALAAVCAAYANSLQNGFHFDDFHTVTDNPAIRSLGNLPRFFTDATAFSVLPPNRTYRPFVSLSLAVDYALGHGYVPFWFHLGTLLVFLLQLVAMFWLFRHMLRAAWPRPDSEFPAFAAVFAVAWYGLHPAMAETVNYIIQRGDIYSTLGVVGALALFVCTPNLRRTGLYLLPFVFGVLSKPPAIALPALLFAYIAYFEVDPATKKTRWRHAAVSTIPSLIVGTAALTLQSAMTPKSFSPATISHANYCLTQPYVLLRYFGSFFLPLHLNVDTDLEPLHTLTAPALCGFVFVAMVLAAIVLTARRCVLRPVSFGFLWFLIASIPTSIYTLSEVENDHRMYMPFVGLTLAVTWSLALLTERCCLFFAVILERSEGPPHSAPSATQRLRQTILALAVILLAAYGYGTHRRNIVWRTEESLWLDDVQKSPHNGRGLMNYGLTQMDKGDYPRALDYFTRALAFTPNYATLEINLGIACGATGDAPHAEQHFERAIRLAPGDDQPHFYYGRWLDQTGRLTDAITQLREAVRLNPARLPPRDLLAQTLAQTGDPIGAVALSRETLALAPDDPDARALLANPPPVSISAQVNLWINASLACYQQHDYDGTIANAQRALRLDPNSAAAWNNIAAGEASLSHWDAAIAAADHAIRLQPDFQLAKNNRAWALREKQKAAR